MTHAQRTSHFSAKRKPLVMATTAACLLLAAGYAQATSCPSPVSSTLTATVDVDSGCLSLTVNNGGAINVSGNPAVQVSTGSEYDTSIVNGGSIRSSTIAIQVDDTSPTHTTQISNSGTIIGQSYAVNRTDDEGFQEVNIYNSGQLVGGIYATDLRNQNGGVITLKSNVNINDIANTGGSAIASLSGDYYQESGSTLRVAIVTASGETDYSYLTAANVVIQSDSTLDVDVKANSGLADGDSFAVVRSSGSFTGSYDSITDNSALFNFTQRTVSNWLYIDAVRASSVEQAARDNSNFPGVGAAQVFDSGASGLQDVVDQLNQLGTTKEVSDAVSQTLPLNNGAAANATMDALSSVSQIVQARIEGSTGLSTGDAVLSDNYVWVKPFGSLARQDDRDGISGYEARSYGLTLGADGALTPRVRLGAALAYADVDIDGNSSVAPQGSQIDVYQLIGYGSYSLDERSNLSVQLDVGQARNQGQRQIAFMSQTANADYDSLTAHAGIGYARNYPLGEASSFTAGVRADYSWVKDEAYSETGAGALNLQVQGRTTDALVLGVEGKYTTTLRSGLQLQANLGVGYDALSERGSVVSAFAGAPTASFATYGAEPSPWQLRAGLGLTHKTASGMEVTGRYDAAYKSDFLQQTVSVKLRWAF